MRRWFALVLAGSVISGCAPAIGDSCSTSLDCSFNGERLCDSSFPGGFCTVFGCDRNTCPDDAVCVEFRFRTPRLAESSCMAPCENDGDCRDDYNCTEAAQVTDGEDILARVLDTDPRRFCIPNSR